MVQWTLWERGPETSSFRELSGDLAPVVQSCVVDHLNCCIQLANMLDVGASMNWGSFLRVPRVSLHIKSGTI